MIFFLPLLLTLFVVSALRGGTDMIIFLPFFLTLGLGVLSVLIALRDGAKKKDPSIPVLPTNPLSRGVHSALRTQRPGRSTSTVGRPGPGGASASGDGGGGGRKRLGTSRSPSRRVIPLRSPPGARERPVG